MAMLAGCRHQASDPATPSETLIERNELQNGDLLLYALPLDYSLRNGDDTSVSEIPDMREANYIHIAMVEREGESLWVIDATLKHNVGRHPLDTALATFTLKNGKLPLIEVYRLKDTSMAAVFIKNAKKFLGRKFDLDFDVEADEMYCSELTRNSYVTPEGDTLFGLCEIDFNTESGESPIYWDELFDLLKIDSPQGDKGILPSDIAESDKVRRIGILKP